MTFAAALVDGEWIRIEKLGELPADTPVAASAGAIPLVLWLTPAGEVRAWEDRCPHRGARLSRGRIRDGQLVCAKHGWRFDTSGCRVAEPARAGRSPASPAYVRVFPTRSDNSGVWVCVNA